MIPWNRMNLDSLWSFWSFFFSFFPLKPITKKLFTCRFQSQVFHLTRSLQLLVKNKAKQKKKPKTCIKKWKDSKELWSNLFCHTNMIPENFLRQLQRSICVCNSIKDQWVMRLFQFKSGCKGFPSADLKEWNLSFPTCDWLFPTSPSFSLQLNIKNMSAVTEKKIAGIATWQMESDQILPTLVSLCSFLW